MRVVHRAITDERIGQLRHMTANGKGYYGGYGLPNGVIESVSISAHRRRCALQLLQ